MGIVQKLKYFKFFMDGVLQSVPGVRTTKDPSIPFLCGFFSAALPFFLGILFLSNLSSSTNFRNALVSQQEDSQQNSGIVETFTPNSVDNLDNVDLDRKLDSRSSQRLQSTNNESKSFDLGKNDQKDNKKDNRKDDKKVNEGGMGVVSLEDSNTRVHLCTSKKQFPFIAGTYITETNVARLTIFEVEIIRDIVSGSYVQVTGAPLVLQILSFLEDDESIETSQFNGFGSGFVSGEIFKMELECHFLSDGVDVQKTSASIVHLGQSLYFFYIHCPVPKEMHLSTNFEVRLETKVPETILHIEPFPVCRIASLSEQKNQQLPPDETISICVRPYSDHTLFSTKRGATHSDEKLYEWMDFHFLLGVRRIYIPDRFGTAKLPAFEKYIKQGLVVHYPFPVWSEVFYRKGRFFNNSKDTYVFPQSYDEFLSNELCTMQARRNNERWDFIIGTDEFIQYKSGEANRLLDTMKEFEARHEEEKKSPMVAIIGNRYNFIGDTSSSKPVLNQTIQRCKRHMMHGSKTFPMNHGKCGNRPRLMHGVVTGIHWPENLDMWKSIFVPSPTDFKIHHYPTTSVEDLKTLLVDLHLCQKEEDLTQGDSETVDDKSLIWAVERMEECKNTSCSPMPTDRCGYLCNF